MPHSSIVHDLRSAHSADALLTGVPLPTLLYFALPIILGNIFQQLYSIVDAIVVGNFLGDLPLSGISVASPIVDVANALVIGGTIGVGVLCAHYCGAGEGERLRCMNATALLGGGALTLLIALCGIFFSTPLLRAQGTEEAVCREAAVYLQLVFAGLLFCFLYNYYAAMLRSCGNSRTPFLILLLSSTLHALLDVLFVGVFGWGIRGVAFSTVLCQALAAAACKLLDKHHVTYCIESFDPRCLMWLWANRPDVVRGQLSENFRRHGDAQDLPGVVRWVLSSLLLNARTRPDFIAYRFEDRKCLSLRLCRGLYGAQEFSWTIRSRADMDAAERDGALVIFECFDPRG